MVPRRGMPWWRPNPPVLLPEEKTLYTKHLNFQNNLQLIERQPEITSLIIKYFEATQLSKLSDMQSILEEEQYMLQNENWMYAMLKNFVVQHTRTQAQIDKEREEMSPTWMETTTHDFAYKFILSTYDSKRGFLSLGAPVADNAKARKIVRTYTHFITSLLGERDLMIFENHMIDFTLYINRFKMPSYFSFGRGRNNDTEYLDKIVRYSVFYKEYLKKEDTKRKKKFI